MYKLIAVSNRAACADDFIRRIRGICDFNIPVILREKDLDGDEYYELLRRIDRPEIIAHTHIAAARRFGCKKIHMPLDLLENSDTSGFEVVGASVHSVSDAKRAEKSGAAYLTAGHVFRTDCKKGLPPRGVKLIEEIKAISALPVFAIGGITPETAKKAIAAQADGVCVMSGFMRAENIEEYVNMYDHILL